MTALTPEKLAGLRIEAAEAMRCRWYAQVLGADLLALLDALEACGSKATSSALSEAKLQALVDMHHTSMRHRKYGREPEWLGAAFTELRAKYEAELEGKTE